MDYKEALEYATRMHSSTPVREGTGEPYITHPEAVAGILRDKGYGLDVQVMGLFHDLLEDTEATEADIVKHSNNEVYEVVKLVSKEIGYDNNEYISRITRNENAVAVKLADRIHNLRDAHLHPGHNWKIKYYNESALKYIHMAKSSKVFYRDFIDALVALKENMLLRKD